MTAGGTKPWPVMTTRDEFRFLSDLVLTHSSGDHTLVSLHDQHNGATRVANNQIVQNVDARRGTFTITVAFGRRHGTASTTDFTAGAVRDTLRRAEQIARLSPEDAEYLPPVGPQWYPALSTSKPETAAAGPARRLELARESVEAVKAEALLCAGLVTSSVQAVGVAANSGLFAFEERTDARFSVTVQSGEATGWASAAHRSIDHLSVAERTQIAIQKARQSVNPRELPAGRYTVVLEPAAVAGLLSWLTWKLDAKSHDKGTSPFSGKLGTRIVDPRLTLRNCPDHPDLLGAAFTGEGLPGGDSVWIEAGVLKELLHDRFTAQQRGMTTIPTLDAPLLSGDESSVEDLIGATSRAVLVTNFWYLRVVNPSDLTLTGMTRDGTFLIEDGRIVSGLRHFRFHVSPLRAFNQLDAFTAPAEATTAETGKLLVPAMRITDFNFSSVTKF
jgi:predicted Zn-dependent protease